MRTFNKYIEQRNKESLAQELEELRKELKQLQKQSGPNSKKINDLIRRERNIRINMNQLSLEQEDVATQPEPTGNEVPSQPVAQTQTAGGVETAQAQQNAQKQQQSVQQVLTAATNINQGLQTLRRELQAAGLGNEFDGTIMSFSGELEKMMQRVQSVEQPQATPQQQLSQTPTNPVQPQD